MSGSGGQSKPSQWRQQWIEGSVRLLDATPLSRWRIFAKSLAMGHGQAIADHLGIASTTLERISNGDTAQPQSGGLLMAFETKRLGLERAMEVWEAEEADV